MVIFRSSLCFRFIEQRKSLDLDEVFFFYLYSFPRSVSALKTITSFQLIGHLVGWQED